MRHPRSGRRRAAASTGVEVQHRLAHAHEDEVVDRLDPPEVKRLVEDLARAQVAAEPHLAGRAERARERAAGLRRDADRAAAVAVAHQHSLDRVVVLRCEQHLQRAVAGQHFRNDAERREGHPLGSVARSPAGRFVISSYEAAPWAVHSHTWRARYAGWPARGLVEKLEVHRSTVPALVWVRMIDLSSDTQTKPSPGMRAAMAAAEVGDEQRREDPTVLALEQRAAAFLGHEEAVYLPTATMANQIALAILGERGDELIVEETRAHHDRRARRRGDALRPADARPPGSPRAASPPEQVRAPCRRDGFHIPRTSIVALENTHNSAGGAVWPLEELGAVVADRARARARRSPRRRAAAERRGRARRRRRARWRGSSTPSRSASRRASAARSAP